MSELLANTPIISVAEVRKIANGYLDDKSDDEIEILITQLDFLAELFLKSVVASKEAAYKKKE